MPPTPKDPPEWNVALPVRPACIDQILHIAGVCHADVKSLARKDAPGDRRIQIDPKLDCKSVLDLKHHRKIGNLGADRQWTEKDNGRRHHGLISWIIVDARRSDRDSTTFVP